MRKTGPAVGQIREDIRTRALLRDVRARIDKLTAAGFREDLLELRAQLEQAIAMVPEAQPPATPARTDTPCPDHRI